MTKHANMSASGKVEDNIASTIFLINLDSNGIVVWHKQYYTDLTLSLPEDFIYHI